MNEKSRKIIVQYLTLSGLSGITAGLLFGTYVIYLTMWGGLSLLEANIVNVCYFLTLFVFEVPTGAFADTYGRKTSFVVSLVIASIGVGLYAVTRSFWWFVLAECLIAIGRTFETGAFESWMVDGLLEAGDTTSYKNIVSRYESVIDRAAAAFGALLGGFLATIDIRLPMAVEATSLLVLAVIAWVWMKEGTISHFRPDHWSEIITNAREGLRKARENSAVAFVLVGGFGLMLAVKSIDMFWSLRFRNVTDYATGWIPFVFMCILAVGSWSVGKIGKNISDRNMLLLVLGAMGIFVLASAVTPILGIALVPFLLYEFPRGMWMPLKGRFIHGSITDSKTRATVASSAEVFNHFAGALGLLLAGLLGEYASIETAWIVSGIIFLGFGAYLYRKR